jgi:hypothetical protein
MGRMAYSVVEEGLQLYHDVPENTVLNDVFFYVMYHLSSFQNMHGYQTTKDTDISEFVLKLCTRLLLQSPVPAF